MRTAVSLGIVRGIFMEDSGRRARVVGIGPVVRGGVAVVSFR